MNGDAFIFKQLIGKTITNVIYSEEDYENTWVTLFFTDGTKYKLEAKALYADSNWLDIEQISEDVPIPDICYLKHVDDGYYFSNNNMIGWTHNKQNAKELSRSGANQIKWNLIDSTMNMKYMEDKLVVINKFEHSR